MIKRREIGWLLAASMVFGLCIAAGEKPATKPAEESGQGVKGKVVKLTGNHMPGPGAAGGESRPLSVPVHIFKGKVKTFNGPANKHESYLKTVNSNKKGEYSVALDAGEYTVVAEIDGSLYLNMFDGEGHWGTAKVAKDKWTIWNIQDTSEAAF